MVVYYICTSNKSQQSHQNSPTASLIARLTYWFFSFLFCTLQGTLVYNTSGTILKTKITLTILLNVQHIIAYHTLTSKVHRYSQSQGLINYVALTCLTLQWPQNSKVKPTEILILRTLLKQFSYHFLSLYLNG